MVSSLLSCKMGAAACGLERGISDHFCLIMPYYADTADTAMYAYVGAVVVGTVLV